MKRLSRIVIAAAWLGCTSSNGWAADPTGGEHQNEYLACYRGVLTQPAYASMDAAHRYQAAGTIARDVMGTCERYIRPMRKKMMKAAAKAERGSVAAGYLGVGAGMRDAIVDSLLSLSVADDLALADPAVKAIADADPRPR